MPAAEPQEEDEEYKTYLIGGTIIGLPAFLYGRSPFAAWGVTALNPDVIDLFVEDINEKDDTYFDAQTGKYEPFIVYEDTIKVRFGSDVKVVHKVTRNGVLFSHDLLDEQAGEAVPWIPREVLKSMDAGQSFSIAWIADPAIHKRMNIETKDVRQTNLVLQKTFAQNITANENGENFAAQLRDWNPYFLNIMFVMLNGDIGYQPTGIFPDRQHNVVQGVYAKLASKKENMWKGILDVKDLPYVVNPDKGYLVSVNNRMTTHRMKYGVSHAFTFNHRGVRISELLTELIANSAEKPIKVKDIQNVTLDLLDV